MQITNACHDQHKFKTNTILTQDGKTPLHIAVQNAFIPIIELLLDKTAKIEAKDKVG